MPLTFLNSDLKGLLIHAEHQWPLELRDLHNEKAPGRGFWIVGDQGVYLMHNGKSHEVAENEMQPVVYAVECNPNTDPDGWFDTKRSTFGGDDGVDFIEAETIQKIVRAGDDMVIDFEDNAMTIYSTPHENRGLSN